MARDIKKSMTNHNQKIQNDRKNGLDQIAAAVTGAIVGAGVAVAGVIALKDEKNRNKVKNALIDAKNQAVDYIEDIRNQAQDKKIEIKEKVFQEKVKVKKIAKIVKNAKMEVDKI